MNKLFFLLLALPFLSVSSAFAQIDAALVAKVTKIHELAKDGHKDKDPKKLMDAAKILKENPKIRSFKGQDPVNSDPALDYFNRKSLLEAAILHTSPKKKRKRRKIQDKIDKIANYSKMSLEDGDLQVEIIKDLEPGESVDLPYAIGTQKWVGVHLQDAKQLAMSLFFEKEVRALISDAKKSPISYDYQTKTRGNYKIEIKNQSNQQSSSTFLMIMY